MRIARIATADGPRSVLADGPDWIEIADPFAGTLNGAAGDRDRPRQAFLKSPRTVVGPGDSIVVDDDLGQINVECELAVVIRRPCRHLTADQVPDAILGFTVGNDVTAVDQIALDEKLTQAKNGDGFTPLGPWIETDLDSSDVAMSVRINGRTVASAS